MSSAQRAALIEALMYGVLVAPKATTKALVRMGLITPEGRLTAWGEAQARKFGADRS